MEYTKLKALEVEKYMESVFRKLEQQYVTLNGVKIRYVVEGNGPPVLLLHGFGQFLECWLLNIEPLSEKYRVYAVDFPGHGLSDKPKIDYSLPAAVRFVTDFMESMEIERPSLVGHSIGGLVSLILAIKSPEKVDKLVLVDCAGLTTETPLFHRLLALPIIGDIIVRPTIRAGTRQGMRKAFYNPDFVTEKMLDLNYKYLKTPGAKEAMLSIIRCGVSLNGPRSEAVAADRLHMVSVPTLLIHGAQDRSIPLKYSKHACRLIPDARLRVIEASGHCPHLEKADEFNEAVVAFLESAEIREVERVG